jgi:hypothetical protein
MMWHNKYPIKLLDTTETKRLGKYKHTFDHGPFQLLVMENIQLFSEATHALLLGLRRLVCHVEGIHTRSCFRAFHSEAIAFAAAAAEDFEA